MKNRDDFYPQKRRVQLGVLMRSILLKERAYRDSTLTRDRMARRVGINKNLFVETFKWSFGMSFPEYINELRLNDSVILLKKSDLSIEIIADRVGFGTVRTFQRQFRAKYNMCPKDYRKINANEE